MAKTKDNPSSFFKSKAFIILILAALLLAIAIPVGYMYYLDYLNSPNFVSPESNFISVSADQASPGDQLTYTIRLANEGRKEANDIHVTTDLPEHTTLIDENTDYLEQIIGNQVKFLIDSLPVGQNIEFSYTVTIDNPLDNGTVISNNSFLVNYQRQGDQETVEKKFETDLKTTVTSNIDFSESYYKITDENGGYIRMGDTLNIVYFVKNSGNMVAENVKIKGIIPANTNLVEGSFSSDSAYMDQVDGETVIKLDKVETNAKMFINYSVQVASGLADNTKVLFEPTIENGTMQAVMENQEFTVRAFPQFTPLSLAGVDENGGDLLPNETVRYTVTFKNEGDGSAFNVFVENAIPDNTTLLDYSLEPSQFNWELQDKVFSVRIAELAPGEEFSYSYRVKVAGGLYYGTKITNTNTLIHQEERLSSQSVTHTIISNYGYNVVVMGDSQVANTNWAGHLNGIFEQKYFYGDFNFIKSGKGGETVLMGYNRMLSSGVLGQSPYIFILNYGTNDADTSSGYYRIAPETFRYYLGAMIDTIKTNTGALVVVMSTGPVNEGVNEAHTNSDLATYSNLAAQVAAQHGAVFVDVFNPMMQSGNPNQYLGDGLHYNSNGDQFVASIAFNTISRHLNQYGTR